MLEKIIIVWEHMRRHLARGLDKLFHGADTMLDRHSSRVPRAQNVVCWRAKKHRKHSDVIRNTVSVYVQRSCRARTAVNRSHELVLIHFDIRTLVLKGTPVLRCRHT